MSRMGQIEQKIMQQDQAQYPNSPVEYNTLNPNETAMQAMPFGYGQQPNPTAANPFQVNVPQQYRSKIKQEQKPPELQRIYRDKMEGFAPLYCRKGFLEPNPLLINTIPYHLTFDEQAGDSVATIPAGSQIRRAMSNDKSGITEVRNLKGIATSGEYLVNLYDNQYQRYLCSRAVHSGTIIGDGEYPYGLPEPLVLNRAQQIIAELTDLSGVNNDVRFAFDGFRYYFDAESIIYNKMADANKISRPYFYTTDADVSLAVLPVGAITTYYGTVINEADFYLYRITSKSTGPYRVIITNLSTGYTYMNSWIYSSLLAGSAKHYENNEPMCFQRRTQLKFDFINMSGVLNKVYLTLAGMNYYYER